MVVVSRRRHLDVLVAVLVALAVSSVLRRSSSPRCGEVSPFPDAASELAAGVPALQSAGSQLFPQFPAFSQFPQFLGVAATQLAADAGAEYAKAFAPIVVGWNEVEGDGQEGGQNLSPFLKSYMVEYVKYIKRVKPLGFTDHITPSESGPLSHRFVEANPGDHYAERDKGDWLPNFLDACCDHGDECTSAITYYVLRGHFRKIFGSQNIWDA